MPNRAEIQERIAASLRGKPSWNKGKKMDASWGERIRVQNTGNIPWNKDTHIQTNTGKTHFKKGQKPAHWKGGISRIQSRIYASSQNKLWREEVFKRDNWTCQTCGFRGDLEAHHIIPMNQLLNRVMIKGIGEEDKFDLAMSIPEMFDPANGITLCKSCHYTKHKRRIKMKKTLHLLLMLSIMTMFAGVSQAHEIWQEPQNGGPASAKIAVYNNSGSALDEGDVVVWDVGSSTGDDDLWVTTTTTTDTELVAGVVGAGGIGVAGTGSITIYGHAQCDVSTSVAAGGLICTKGTAGGGGACNEEDAAYAIASAAITASQGNCFVLNR